VWGTGGSMSTEVPGPVDDLRSWLAARDAIARVVSERGVRMVDTHDRVIVISTERSPETIVISNAADGDAVLRTGLAIEIALPYFLEDEVRPPPLVYFIEGVLTGGSREGAVLDADGAWIGTTWEVHSPYGSWGGQDERKEQIAWRPPPVW
jgi:hypothetical protein